MAVDQVTLSAELLASVQELVGADGSAAFIEAAIERAIQDRKFRHILDDLEGEVGPTPENLRAEAEAFWRAG